MNSVIITGRLTKDVECKYTQSQMAVAQFTVAVNRPKDKDGKSVADFPRCIAFGKDGKSVADFPRCIAFGKTAENLEKFTAKGRLIAVQGRIQTGKYKNRDGETVYTTDIIADRVEFLEWGEKKGRNDRDDDPYDEENPYDGFAAVSEDVPF